MEKTKENKKKAYKAKMQTMQQEIQYKINPHASISTLCLFFDKGGGHKRGKVGSLQFTKLPYFRKQN